MSGGWLFSACICFALRVEGAIFCGADPYIVLRGCFPVCGSSIISFEAQMASFASSGLVGLFFPIGGCSFSGMFHLVVSFFLCVRVLMLCVQQFWFYDIYLLFSRNFGIGRFRYDCYILFCCYRCIYLFFVGLFHGVFFCRLYLYFIFVFV